ncbi:hypothetical protein DIU31_023330 [Mucilaginibacter rubeus]|uniref:TIGR04141 family sporadically distributed protein n=1 Tax=Mucilaginibacter rubeus TaxID=2027860 RepID=A0AAE6JIZ4_9SPHI|nr:MULTISPECIES: TIGR04141 family sporadically distributed protein [Mucilaginibacter]QEM06308.1 hypothetical protein DIU31_023330 [Mucilaginibacter rubeus]QEM18891.1 hypothetical protein DIU38_023570 [Mucilaginibacter gossypii]QTE44566.1 TIGR04141 family sporadically distributed protein [Mucilaginibacter rubeus]QTE51164.1 TIGR04141 family sporadically distributed protein [Mucilaginibacter rubeus]QTE56252.1 TIGR04141 family sporadically distributed protein [Mucilaginibacter rubeus]
MPAPIKPTANKIKLYLIKPAYKDFMKILKDPAAAALRSTVLPGIGTLYYKQSFPQTPEWLKDFFENHPALHLGDFKVSSTSAVLLVEQKIKTDSRIFALTFGGGRHLLHEFATEGRFGLITTLNIVEPAGLRSMIKTTLSANPKISAEQVSRASDTKDFQINIEQDIVESITGSNTHPDFGKIISGKDALSVTGKITAKTLSPFLKKIFLLYSKKDYRTNFKWIDQIQEIKDSKLIDQLNSILLDGINKVIDIPLWMAVPEIIDWSDFNGFKYSNRKTDDLHEDLDLEVYISAKGGKPISYDDLKHDIVSCWRESKDNSVLQWSVFKCLNSELTHGIDLYFLDKGKWYKLERSFVKEVKKVVAEIKIYPKVLPDFKHKDEGDYNLALATSLKALLLDARNVPYGGGASKIEVCDILTPQQEFFHIKKYGGSSTLSHLFAQGFVSGELFASDSIFREKVKKHLSVGPPYNAFFSKDRPAIHQYKVIYGVITASKKGISIPFFSQVTLKNYKRILEGYGYTLYLAEIKNINPPSKPPKKKKAVKP